MKNSLGFQNNKIKLSINDYFIMICVLFDYNEVEKLMILELTILK